MESVGAMFDGEWSSFNGTCSPEEADFMIQLLGNCSLPNEVLCNSNFGLSSGAFWPCQGNEGPTYSSEDTSADMYSFSQGISHSGGSTSFLPVSSIHEYYPGKYPPPILMGNSIVDGKMISSSSGSAYININLMETGDEFLTQDLSNDSIMESDGSLPEGAPEGKTLQLGREHEFPETSLEDKEDSLSERSMKRPRLLLDVKNKRIVKPKKNEKPKSTDKNDEISCPSEDDSNASPELNGEAAASVSTSKGAAPPLNLNGKTRASRGSATDPQSLYARKRRERINERLRILQNLVPNGTKVDISTMLEEAVQYVKFLQLQIKLLSSDDLWMYAPIAYNGMNIGLDLKTEIPKS